MRIKLLHRIIICLFRQLVIYLLVDWLNLLYVVLNQAVLKRTSLAKDTFNILFTEGFMRAWLD